jgi:predicted P-loop ATPase
MTDNIFDFPLPPKDNMPSITNRTPCNVYTALAVLKAHPDVSNLFVYNQMSRATVVRGTVPGSPHIRASDILEDADVVLMQVWLQQLGLTKISTHTVAQAIETRARDKSFHPIKDYLEGLEWDNTKRVNNFLPDYLNVNNNEYHRLVGRFTLLSMIKRIYEPGCKMDYMPLLIGEQGNEKDKFLGTLAGADYFGGDLPSIRYGVSKDAKSYLRGLWLILIPELDAFNKAENSTVKLFITTPSDKYRPPYGRYDITVPRSSIFAGTTNEYNPLRDKTGNRRYWPVVVTAYEISKLEDNRDQLFAEAVVLYKQKELIYPDRKTEKEIFLPAQLEHESEPDIWTEWVEAYVKEKDSRDGFSVSDVYGRMPPSLQYCGGGDAAHRIGTILRKLECEYVRNSQSRKWYPKGKRPI